MSATLTYRPGGLGAMMDEYERAARDLFNILASCSEAEFTAIHENEDETMRSIQLIMQHVVRSSYGYINKIRKTMGIEVTEKAPETVDSAADAIEKLTASLRYNAATFEGGWKMTDEELDTVTMLAPWNVNYTLEQMLEHAIVHILRHRRQIERLLAK